MDFSDEQLRQIVASTCGSPAGSAERQKKLAQLVRAIQQSGKLWRENSFDYEDALQQTWIYFCRNLCESLTGDRYNPEKANVITWLNAYLKRRLQDNRIESAKKKRWVAPINASDPDREQPDPIENLPAPADVPPILEELCEWIETDPERDLRRTHIRDRPDVNCQVLIRRRLPPETPWETLADEYQLPAATLSSFYQRQCLPRLRKFGQDQGYL